MASTTPYKDELIRIAAIMGLPDDVEPTDVAEAVAEIMATVKAGAQALGVEPFNPEAFGTALTKTVNDAGLLAGVDRMRAHERTRAEQFRDGLEDAATAMEKARDDLREKAGADLVAAHAIITRIAGDLNGAAQAADTALEEPTPPASLDD